MRRRQPPEEQVSLFADLDSRKSKTDTPRAKAPAKGDSTAKRTWQMPSVQGHTVAEIRLRWPKRLTPAQVARVEAALSGLPQTLGKLGFGAVQVERAFVRRRRS